MVVARTQYTGYTPLTHSEVLDVLKPEYQDEFDIAIAVNRGVGETRQILIELAAQGKADSLGDKWRLDPDHPVAVTAEVVPLCEYDAERELLECERDMEKSLREMETHFQKFCLTLLRVRNKKLYELRQDTLEDYFHVRFSDYFGKKSNGWISQHVTAGRVIETLLEHEEFTTGKLPQPNKERPLRTLAQCPPENWFEVWEEASHLANPDVVGVLVTPPTDGHIRAAAKTICPEAFPEKEKEDPLDKLAAKLVKMTPNELELVLFKAGVSLSQEQLDSIAQGLDKCYGLLHEKKKQWLLDNPGKTVEDFNIQI